jgi:hypothetical protein
MPPLFSLHALLFSITEVIPLPSPPCTKCTVASSPPFNIVIRDFQGCCVSDEVTILQAYYLKRIWEDHQTKHGTTYPTVAA